MGMLDKLKTKLEAKLDEARADLGLGSQHGHQQQQPHPPQGYPQQQQQQQWYPPPPPPQQQQPPHLPPRPHGFDNPPPIPARPEVPHGDADVSTPPDSPYAECSARFFAVDAVPERSSQRRKKHGGGGNNDDDSDSDDEGDDDGGRELTEEEIWRPVPAEQVVWGPDGRRDVLGGQTTGHEQARHVWPMVSGVGVEGGGGGPRYGRMMGLYYPEWLVYRGRPPSKMQNHLATHVYYAFVVPRKSGRLRYSDRHAAAAAEADRTTGCLNAMRKIRDKYPNVKLLLSLGGGTSSGNFKTVAAEPRRRLRFAKSVKEWIDRYELNGVDIDWEFPDTEEHGVNYIKLLQAVRAYLPRPFYQLTTALPAGEWVLRNINLAAAAVYLDFLNVMAYDLAGPWSETSGHQAALFPTSSGGGAAIAPAIDYLLKHGFPPWKIVLGIPAYAQCFPGACGPDESFDKGKATQLEYRDIKFDVRRAAHVDCHCAVATCLDHHHGRGFMSYDTPQTVAVKADYVLRMGLAGLFYWHGAGDVRGPMSLVEAGSRGLQN